MVSINTLVSSLTLSGNPAGTFGTSISVSADGTRFVVGSASAMYFYTRPTASSTQCTLINTITNDYASADGDVSVAISPDGSTVAAKFEGETQDTIKIYTVSVSNGVTSITFQKSLVGVPGFGDTMAFSGDGNIIAIGSSQETVSSSTNSGIVYVWSRSGSSWSLSQTINNPAASLEAYFGHDLSISLNGSILAIGAMGEANTSGVKTGAAYVYNISSTPSLVKTIKADDCKAGSSFGSSVSLSKDGKRLAIGAFGMDDNQQQSVADENAALVIYKETNGTWSLEDKKFALGAASQFYAVVDLEMSGDGNSMAVSYISNTVSGTFPDRPILTVFDYDGAQWSQQGQIGAIGQINSSLASAIAYAYNPSTVFATDPLYGSTGQISVYEVTGLTDLIAPTLSSSTVTVLDQDYYSLKLRWSAASDNMASRTGISYDVRYSSSNNMSTISQAESNGTLYTTVTGSDLATLEQTVSDLAVGSAYYFTIIARDAAGNKTPHPLVTGSTLVDNTPPVPVTNGAPISYTSTKTSVTLTWPLATDNATLQASIQYAVYRVPIFTQGYTGSIETTESMGTLVMSYTSNVGTYTEQSLLPGSLYGYNVIAKDASGNKVAYSPVSATTQADNIAPTVSNKTLTFSNASFTGYKISWNSASDDFTAGTSIYYMLYESVNSNISTVSDAETNGTAIAQFFGLSGATQEYTVSGRSPNTLRYYNVIARDAAGNKVAYTSASTSTLADTAGPTYSSSPTVTSSYDSVTVSYSAGQDNYSSSQNIQYALYRTPSSMSTISQIESNGTVIQDYVASTADIVVPNLQPGTTYYFALIGKDEAGNKTLYSAFSKTTLQDSTVPVPGSGGFVTKSNVTQTSFTMSWERATDNVTNSLDLEYAVYSTAIAGLFDTWSMQITSGVSGSVNTLASFTKDLRSLNVTNVSPTSTTYYAVVVKDQFGNRAQYQVITNRNSSDVTGPIPGGSGALTITANGYDALFVAFAQATDNFSSQQYLQYKIVRSSSNNVSTVSDVEANGATIYNWGAYPSPFLVTGLIPGQFYFFNVLVRDADGNVSAYVSRSGRPLVDNIPPVISDRTITIDESVIPSSTSLPNIQVSWQHASDNVVASDVKYTAYLVAGDVAMSTVQEVESSRFIRKVESTRSQAAQARFEAVSIGTYSINVIAEDSRGNKIAYNKCLVTTPGDIYPPSVSVATISATSRSQNSIKIMWNPASDVLSPSVPIEYQVYYSLSNNIASVSNILANGTLAGSGTYASLGVAANNGYSITGLSDGTAYYVNVIAMDAAGNKLAYTSLSTSTLNEVIAPTVSPLSLSIGQVTDTSISMSWGAASDNKTPAAQLQYAVFRSTSVMQQSVASIESGTKVMDWTANTTSYTANSLSRNTRYYFGVVVRDQAGNKSVYAPINALTAGDSTPPVVPQSNGGMLGNISYSSGYDIVVLSGPVSTDNVTSGQNLVYRVYRSASSNITTVADMLSNGTYLGNATIVLSRDLSTGAYVYDQYVYIKYTDWKLPANTGYYYNIMVVDAAGNRSAYTPVYARTTAQYVAPIVGNSGKINASTSGAGTLNLSWSLASDESQSGSQLEYSVYYSPRQTNANWGLKNEFPPISDAYDIESKAAAGLITQASPYTQGMSSFSISGLQPAAEYMVNVVVRDATGSRSAYNAAKVWTLTDTGAPTPGLSGVLTTSYVNDTGFTLTWAKASDDYSAQNRLRYEARISASNNIATVDTFKNGTIVMPFTTDVNSFTVTKLSPSTQYYVNVMVMDVAGNKAVYQTAAVTTAADFAGPVLPTPSTMTFSQIEKQQMRVSWVKATDNSTASDEIEYALYMSMSSSVMSTIGQLESNAQVVQDYMADTSYAIVTDLDPGATYHFNVIARDQYGNKTAYTASSATTLQDLTPPTPGNGGALLPTSVSQTSATLSWSLATDDVSEYMVYRLYKSLSNDMNTPLQLRTTSTASLVESFTNGQTSYTVNDLNPDSTYYFNLLVEDGKGNEALYNTTTVNTIVDTTVPSPGNSGVVTASMVTSDSVVLNWTKGTDNVSTEGNLQYAIYMSTSDNITSLSDVISNGTMIKSFVKNINTVSIDKLQPLTNYWFNVVVRDSFGNMSAYNSVSTTTLADTTGPTPGGGGVIIFNSVDKDSMIVTWNPAEDNNSSGVQMQYQLRMAMSNLGVAPDFSTVAATEANGTIVKAYSNATYALVSNLVSNTTYYFNVIAKDAAGNKSVYVSASQKTANNLVEIPTQAVEVNQPVVIASNRDEIKSLPAVAMHPTLSRPSNWKKVHMVYKSTTSSKRVVVVITDFSQMSGQFITRDTEEFAIHKIIVEDENNNFVAVPASSILNSQSWSISVT